MPDLNQLISELEAHEQNLADFEDSRFGEIYLDDQNLANQQGEFYE